MARLWSLGGTIISFALTAVAAGCATSAAPEKPEAAKAEPQSKPAANSATKSSAYFDAGRIDLCPTAISNSPRLDADGKAFGGPVVEIKGAALMLAPATNSCLSSGYGPRSGKLHRGVDYYSKTGGAVLAAGDGVIKEAIMRSDFGNMIVIDHGGGVFTRYAHLASFRKGVVEGGSVSRGDELGPIGQTGATSVRHLHYEILTGAYVGAVGSFGLSAHNPFDLPTVIGGKHSGS